jgi:hypothetical protein
MNTYKGIDYSLGQSNVDRKTSIHYGVISERSVIPELFEDVEYDYGDPTCRKCGNKAIESSAIADEAWNEGKDYACVGCKRVFWSDDAFSDEAIAWNYEQDGYTLTSCLDSDIFVLKSPYYTFTQYCSPCVPGAGNLDTYVEDGVKTYCLGHDFFDTGKAPYPVYDVASGKLIVEEEQENE